MITSDLRAELARAVAQAGFDPSADPGLRPTGVPGQYASSRTILTRITPPAQAGAFFGVYALAGVATSWLAPTLVNFGTHATHSQQGGFAMIPILLAIGLVGLMFVKGGEREAV